MNLSPMNLPIFHSHLKRKYKATRSSGSIIDPLARVAWSGRKYLSRLLPPFGNKRCTRLRTCLVECTLYFRTEEVLLLGKPFSAPLSIFPHKPDLQVADWAMMADAQKSFALSRISSASFKEYKRQQQWKLLLQG